MQELIPNLRNVFLEILLNLPSLIETREEVHNRSSYIDWIPNTADDFMGLVAFVTLIPLGIVTFLDPNRRVGDLFALEISHLQIDIEE